MTCVRIRGRVCVWEVAARVAVARVAAARAAAGRRRRGLGDEGGVCLGVCVRAHARRWSVSGMVAATALDVRCDVRGARAYAVRVWCV